MKRCEKRSSERLRCAVAPGGRSERVGVGPLVLVAMLWLALSACSSELASGPGPLPTPIPPQSSETTPAPSRCVETPGTPCGTCGVWRCESNRDVCDDPGQNVCGGCAVLEANPGDACEVDGVAGHWRCDTDSGDLVCDASVDENLCGGAAELEGAPGSPCGVCEDGTWNCAGPEAVVCVGATEANACGGCGELPADVGDACGCADGVFACEGTALRCTDPDANACGGCAPLDGIPGDVCDLGCGESVLVCSESRESLRCRDAEVNACGGCDTLSQPLDEPCELGCGAGVWECAPGGDVQCSVRPNSCGGCDSLSPPVGTPCDTVCGQGEYVCDGSDATGDSVVCDAPQVNACGGCTQLEGDPGDACGCGGTIQCVDNDVLCVGGLPINACGGCGPLQSAPGRACGDAGCGTWECVEAGDAVTCIDEPANACGGCGPLSNEGEEGERCGCNGQLECQGGDLLCVGEFNNACGGCEEIAEPVGQACGAPSFCGTWSCSSSDSAFCDDPGANDCGGCAELGAQRGQRCNPSGDNTCGFWTCLDEDEVFCRARPLDLCTGCEGAGDACGTCGRIECREDGVPYCEDPGANACGGCGELEGEVGEVCGAAGVCATLQCSLSGEDLLCQPSELNGCLGCGELEGEPGDSCGECGSWFCDAEGDALLCDDPGRNACGGCGTLGSDATAAPGDQCGNSVCGTLECTEGNDGLRCVDPGVNVCGGCGALDGFPGASCGTCGVFVCDEEEGLRCEEETNACGGCGVLPPDRPVGATCGTNGRWVCSAGGTEVVCADEGLNACGGFEALTGEPGESCGPCEEWVCDGLDSVTCVTRTNACGGCGPLEGGSPGETCGDGAACGRLVCTEDRLGLVCNEAEPNACGGCAELSGEPGEACSPCGIFACDEGDPDQVICAETLNACEGCGDLGDGSPGDPCGECGQLVCGEGGLALECADPGRNVCDGCSILPPGRTPGEACGACGEEICSEDGEDIFCLDAGKNVCGGCAELGPFVPGTQCGPCAGDLFFCESEEALGCDRSEVNDCGGCATLEAVPGTPCPCGGDWLCNGTEAVACEGLNACGVCVGDDVTPTPLGAPCRTESDACGTFVCVAGEVVCEQTGELNACGGCAPIPNRRQPGQPCSPCDGVYVCEGTETTRCEGANACGGCGPVENLELLGSPCPGGTACGVHVCLDGNSVGCPDIVNECGGCFELPPSETPGDPCDCGTWICDPDGSGGTICPGLNICGGCEVIPQLERLGEDCELDCADPTNAEACALLDEGNLCVFFECSEDQNSLICSADTRNECGGCFDIPDFAEVGTPCLCGIWECDPQTGATRCDGMNACGGCSELPNTPGSLCAADGCSRWACQGADAVTCSSLPCEEEDEGP